MLKSAWVKVIEEYSQPMENKRGERKVKRKPGVSGSMDVFVNGIGRKEDGRGKGDVFIGEIVDISSDNFYSFR